jgi:hypothetical protein
MATQTDICNRALQELGEEPITDISDDSKRARACRIAYEPSVKAELQAREWTFSIKRASLSALSTSPEFIKGYAYQLPSDFLQIARPDQSNAPYDRDWMVEGQTIVTDDSAPIYLRYVSYEEDTSLWHPLFCEAVALRMARAMCEQLTQSNTKRNVINTLYREAIEEARRANGFMQTAVVPPDPSWLAERHR